MEYLSGLVKGFWQVIGLQYCGDFNFFDSVVCGSRRCYSRSLLAMHVSICLHDCFYRLTSCFDGV